MVAVATKTIAAGRDRIERSHENDLQLRGFLTFLDEPKASAGPSLTRLKELGITVKVATGDNPWVAEKVCAELGLVSAGSVTGADLAVLDDEEFADTARNATIFARVSPEQKARLVRTLRTHGPSVAFLGDGVNGALALHAADVGVSVDPAPMWPRTLRTWCCWRRISVSSPTESPKGAAPSPTPSSTC